MPHPSLTSRPGPSAPLGAYLLMIAVGLGLAGGLGALASTFRDQQPVLTFVVFSLVLTPACLGVSWLLFVARHTVRPPEHADQGVESQWLQRSASGAFFDVVMALGLALVAAAVTGIDLALLPVLTTVLIAAMVDVAARYLVLSRREG